MKSRSVRIHELIQDRGNKKPLWNHQWTGTVIQYRCLKGLIIVTSNLGKQKDLNCSFYQYINHDAPPLSGMNENIDLYSHRDKLLSKIKKKYLHIMMNKNYVFNLIKLLLLRLSYRSHRKTYSVYYIDYRIHN